MLRCLKVAAMTAVAFTMLQSPAFADPSATDTAAKEKKICKNEIVTGSIRTKRICYTKDQWAALEARSRSELERRRNEDTARGMVGMNR